MCAILESIVSLAIAGECSCPLEEQRIMYYNKRNPQNVERMVYVVVSQRSDN